MKKGFVSLVGAGPGDPKLLTLRAKEVLEASEVVIYDHLVNPAILQHAHQAKPIYVGKRGGDPESTSQAFVERLILKFARQGKRIVRLKGGDPFVFGRGGEEALWLSRHKIPFEVVSGITAGIAAPSYAGIPITHRGLASEVTFLTAHEDPVKKKSALNWKALALLKGTLVLYMGVRRLRQTVRSLLKHGKKPETPVSVIRWGTTAEQGVVSGTLRTIADDVKRAHLTPPAITVVGDVNLLRPRLQWFERKPLFGKRVLVTRSRRQASQLAETLESLGARVLQLPTIQILPARDFRSLDQAISRIRKYDWLVFTSENGVSTFFNRLRKLKKDGRSLSSSNIAAVGPGTAARLQAYSMEPDLVPRTYSTEGLIEGFRKYRIAKKNFLLLRTNIAPDSLRVSLEDRGAFVTEIPIYRTEKPQGLSRKLAELSHEDPIDYVTFTSSSTAENFFQSLRNGRTLGATVISIGPVTSKTIRRFGVHVNREARVHTISGLVQAILEEAKQCHSRVSGNPRSWIPDTNIRGQV